jgi:hypothetical protein
MSKSRLSNREFGGTILRGGRIVARAASGSRIYPKVGDFPGRPPGVPTRVSFTANRRVADSTPREMKCGLLVLCVLGPWAIPPPPSATAATLEAGPLEPVPVVRPDGPYTEVPPFLLPDERGLLLSSGWTYVCPNTRLEPPIRCPHAEFLTGGDARFHTPEAMPDRPWRRNYQGAYAAEVLGGRLVTFNHAENKNEVIGDQAYQNTVQPSVTVEDCWSGIRPTGVYEDCGAAYNGFITATTGNGTDRGPIVWPEGGYLDRDGSRVSRGVRHPHSIRVGRYVYLFYVDDSPSGERAGLRVARAPIGRRGRGFRVWHEEGTWDRALPPGFSKREMDRFYATPGARSTPLLAPGAGTSSFAVARLAGEGIFLGIEQYFDADENTTVAIRQSRDLVHWGPRIDLGVPAADFGSFPLSYPIFLDAAGTAHTRVGDRFYVLGTGVGGQVHRIGLRLTP